jgi:preprotein translocase subunit SecE
VGSIPASRANKNIAMPSLINFFKESFIEVKERVSWPTWKELFSTTNVVVVACLVLSLVIALSDFVVSFVLKELIKTLN